MAMVGFTFVNPEVNPTEAALGTGFGHVGHVGDSFAMVSPWFPATCEVRNCDFGRCEMLSIHVDDSLQER